MVDSVSTAVTSLPTASPDSTRPLPAAFVNAAREGACHHVMLCVFHASALLNGNSLRVDEARRVLEIGLDAAVRVRFKFGEACCRKNLVAMRLLKKGERVEEGLREVSRALRLFRGLRVPEGEGACLVLRSSLLTSVSSNSEAYAATKLALTAYEKADIVEAQVYLNQKLSSNKLLPAEERQKKSSAARRLAGSLNVRQSTPRNTLSLLSDTVLASAVPTFRT